MIPEKEREDALANYTVDGVVNYKARRRDAFRWREAGMTYSAIGKRFGVTGARAKSMVAQAQAESLRTRNRLQEESRNFSEHLRYIWPRKNANQNRKAP